MLEKAFSFVRTFFARSRDDFSVEHTQTPGCIITGVIIKVAGQVCLCIRDIKLIDRCAPVMTIGFSEF